MYDYQRVRYEFGEIDYGGSDAVSYVLGPKGKKGWLWDVGVYNVTEAFAGATLTPGIKVGTESDDDIYMKLWDMGALAIISGGKTMRSTYHPASTAWAALMVKRTIAADVAVKVSHRCATNTPTGKAKSFLEIAWEK